MSESTLPPPPVAGDADLKDFAFTPLYRARLFGSAFHAKANDSEWRAGVTLWLKSWDQMPAGSLPDDDIQLCRLAELGRDLEEWLRVKQGALHGWSRCSDGRLYHEVVAEGVNEAWNSRLERSRAGKKGADKRWGRTQEEASQPPAPTQKAAPLANHYGADSLANGRGIAEPMPSHNEGDGIAIAELWHSNSKGQGQGQGQGKGERESKKDSEANASAAVSTIDQSKVFWDRAKSVMAAYGVPQARVGPLVGRWRRDYGDSAVEAALMAVERDAPSEVVSFVVGCLNRWKDSQNGRNLSAANQRFLDGRAATLRAAIERDPSLAAGFAWPDSG